MHHSEYPDIISYPFSGVWIYVQIYTQISYQLTNANDGVVVCFIRAFSQKALYWYHDTWWFAHKKLRLLISYNIHIAISYESLGTSSIEADQGSYLTGSPLRNSQSRCEVRIAYFLNSHPPSEKLPSCWMIQISQLAVALSLFELVVEDIRFQFVHDSSSHHEPVFCFSFFSMNRWIASKIWIMEA